MINLEKIEKRNWILTVNGKITELSLNNDSLSNKFEIVQNLIEEIKILMGEEKLKSFTILLEEYLKTKNPLIILNNSKIISDLGNDYVDAKKVNFESFINRKKTSKNSIVFDVENLRALAVSSTSLKLYFIFYCDNRLAPNKEVHKKIYENLISTCIETETTTKIFELIKSKVYISTVSDKYMWDMLKLVINQVPENFILDIFNFLINNMMRLLDVDKNPVPFFVALVNDSLRWTMLTNYQTKYIYNDFNINTGYGSESFSTFCNMDTIAKCCDIALDFLKKDMNVFMKRIEENIACIDILTPPMKVLNLPIISKILQINYEYLLTVPPKHIIYLSILIYYISKNENYFEDYILNLLVSLPDRELKSYTVRSMYKLKNIEFILNDKKNMMGFQSKIFKNNTISTIIGVLNTNISKSYHILTDKHMNKDCFTLENQLVYFYSRFYNGDFDKTFKEISDRIDVLINE